MRKIFTTIVILATSMSVYSQISQGSMSVSVSGSYYNGRSSNGVATNSLSTNDENVNAGISVQYFVKNNIFVGAGFDYYWGEQEIYNLFLSKTFSQIENANIKSNLYLPNIFVGYSFKVVDNLFFNLNMKFAYGQYINKLNSDYIYNQNANDDLIFQYGSVNEVLSWSADNNSDYLASSISPEINYFFSKKFGFCIRLGGIEYSIQNWNKNQTSWIVNFNPNFWRLGIKYNI